MKFTILLFLLSLHMAAADHISGVGDLMKTPGGQKLGVIYNGTDIRVIQKKGNFYKVSVEGWVPSSVVYVKQGQASSSISTPLIKNNKLLDINKIKVLDVVGVEDGSSGMTLEGSVRNGLSRGIHSIKLQAEYFDNYENMMKRDYIYVRYGQAPLYPNQKIKFHFPKIFDSRVTSYAVEVMEFEYAN